jgi:rSAM/selenodomain-associated transferase 1
MAARKCSRECKNAKHQYASVRTIGAEFLEVEFKRGPCHVRDVSNERLIIFLKAPCPGLVKTRIAETAGNERACAIYRQLVDHVLANIGLIRDVQLRFAPDDGREEIQHWLRDGWSAQPQGPGDLGERLCRAFDESFSAGASRVVIIGSDCPEVGASDARAAFKELKSYDIVVGPAVDGGYWLIGLRAPQPELFQNIAWSSENVLAQTLAKTKTLGLRVQLLRILTDIDTETDWNAYVRERMSHNCQSKK